jgi:MFS family permease
LYNNSSNTTNNGRTTPPVLSPTAAATQPNAVGNGPMANGPKRAKGAHLNNNNNCNTNTSSNQQQQQLLNNSNNCPSKQQQQHYSTASVNLNGDVPHSVAAVASTNTPNDNNNTTSGSNSCNTNNSDDPETKQLYLDLVSKKCQNVASADEYHEYVNATFDKPSPDDDDKKTLLSTTHKESTDSTTGGDGEGDDEKHEDIKPLLTGFRRESERPESGGGRKPKSIVKSTSAQSFPRDAAGFPAGYTRAQSQKPRLSFQHNPAKTDVERPALRVQFEPTTSDEEGEHCVSPTGSLTSHEMPSTASSSSSSSSSSNGNSSDYSEAKPPDGGYGWVVVFASFMINAIADGITFSFGVFYVEFLDYFGEGKAKTAWIGSLFMAMPLLSGPIASFLTDRYGCRKVTIVGSILACAGFVLSTLATSIEVLFLTFGILAGFGLSLCYVAAVVIVAYYFDKRRSFATGLSVCGSGIGTFIFAPFTQYLLDLYGWRGTTLILAGIFLNMTVCGVLMRDLEWTTHRAKLKRKNQKLGRSAESFSVSNSTNTNGRGSISAANQVNGEDDVFGNHPEGGQGMLDPEDPRLFSSLITLPTYVKNGEKVSVLKIFFSSPEVGTGLRDPTKVLIIFLVVRSRVK